MSENEMITPQVTAPTPDPESPVVVDVVQSMQGQAAGMIAMDVESFSNGFMQIMLAGIGWATAEIAKTDGASGETELTFFTKKLSTDLPQIIQNVTAASKGQYTASGANAELARKAKSGFFSK